MYTILALIFLTLENTVIFTRVFTVLIDVLICSVASSTCTCDCQCLTMLENLQAYYYFWINMILSYTLYTQKYCKPIYNHDNFILHFTKDKLVHGK